MPVRHVVTFRFSDGTSAEQIAALTEALGRLPGAIPEIADYRFGSDVGINDGNGDLAVSADFATLADYLVYRDHPQHQALIRDLIAPILAERIAVQFAT